MSLEPVKSNFQFSNPKIVDVEFKTNDFFDSSKYKAFGVKYETEISDKTDCTANVALVVRVGFEEETVPFTIRVKVIASFRWNDEIDSSMADQFLDKNARVLLLSYIRPFIAHLAVDAGYPPFVLPFYDFSRTN